eukprot:11683741-Alexandrium_andersonii.AAC.1
MSLRRRAFVGVIFVGCCAAALITSAFSGFCFKARLRISATPQVGSAREGASKAMQFGVFLSAALLLICRGWVCA